MDFGADLDSIFFADFGVAASFGAATTKGLLDVVSTDAFGQSDSIVVGKTKTLLIKSGALGPIRNGSVITVGAVKYEVLESRFEDDGQLQKLYLADA